MKIGDFVVGSASDTVTAVAALAALYFARKAWLASQAQAHATQKMLELENTRENRAEHREIASEAAAAQAAQADSVTAWLDGYRVVLKNGSPLPVYELPVNYVSLNGLDEPVVGSDWIGTFPPGEQTRPIKLSDGYDEAVDEEGNVLTVPPSPDELGVAIGFNDAAGRKWRRSDRGNITQLDAGTWRAH